MRTRLIAGALAALAMLGACSVSPTTSEAPAVDEPTTEAPDTAFPVTVVAANGEVTIDERPQAIVSLSPTATEMVFAVGAGDQVVAVDEYSYFPEEAPVTDLSGFTPNLEAISVFDPDLVVVSDDVGGIIGALGGLGIPVLHLPAAWTLDDVWAQIEELGAATGHLAEAVRLTGELQARVDEILASGRPESLTYFHELDSSLFTATSVTFIGEVYSLLGLGNIADVADPDGSGYPQLSPEYVLEADPDVIFLADAAYGESAETVAARPGWADLTAVRTGAVFAVDADIASRWGPRIVDFLETVAEDLASLESVAG